jgi:hypothetical protein
MLLTVVGVVLGVRAARNRLPMWAARTALAVGVVVAAFTAFLTHRVVGTAPLFPQSQEVPSVVDSAPSPQYMAAVERARELVRSAVATWSSRTRSTFSSEKSRSGKAALARALGSPSPTTRE